VHVRVRAQQKHLGITVGGLVACSKRTHSILREHILSEENTFYWALQRAIWWHGPTPTGTLQFRWFSLLLWPPLPFVPPTFLLRRCALVPAPSRRTHYYAVVREHATERERNASNLLWRWCALVPAPGRRTHYYAVVREHVGEHILQWGNTLCGERYNPDRRREKESEIILYTYTCIDSYWYSTVNPSVYDNTYLSSYLPLICIGRYCICV
jgi:hypothetical protein